MSDFILFMNGFAMGVGYTVTIVAICVFIHDTSEVRLRGGVKDIVFLGFGVLWFKRAKEAKLYLNAGKCGYRLGVVGKYVFGPIYPRWFVWTVKKITGRNPL